MPGMAQRCPSPVGQKRDAEEQDWNDQVEERRLRRTEAYERKKANMRTTYDAGRRRERYQAAQEALRQASQATVSDSDTVRNSQSEPGDDSAQSEPAVNAARSAPGGGSEDATQRHAESVGRGRGRRPKQQPNQEHPLEQPQEQTQPVQARLQPKERSAPTQSSVAAPQARKQKPAKRVTRKEPAPGQSEAAEGNRQQPPAETAPCPRPKRKNSRKQKD